MERTRRWRMAILLITTLALPGGPALAQEPIAEDPAADLWLLGSQTTVSRLDGETGELVGQIDVTTDECYWERLAGPADGAIWLMDSGEPGKRPPFPGGEGVKLSRFCIGRFPTDGNEPEVFWIEPDKATVDVRNAVVLDDVLWLAAWIGTTGAIRADQYGLYRLDLSAGAEQAGLERVLGGVAAVGRLGDGLVIGQLPRKGKLAWRPASFTPGADKATPLDIGLKKKESFEGSIATGDGLVAFLDDKPAVYGPATGTLVRPKMPRYWSEDNPTVVTREAIWTAPDWSQLYSIPLADGAKPNPATDACNELILAAGGECPLIVGTTAGAVWVADLPVVDENAAATTGDPVGPRGALRIQRFDTATGEPTIAVDATDLMDRTTLRPD